MPPPLTLPRRRRRAAPNRDLPSAQLLRLLHATSGLTWADLASLLGVSRSALTYWASGEPMSAEVEKSTADLTELLSSQPHMCPDIRRRWLLTADVDGFSPLDRLRHSAHPSEELKPTGVPICPPPEPWPGLFN